MRQIAGWALIWMLLLLPACYYAIDNSICRLIFAGITPLSDSVEDAYYSPISTATGFSAGFYNPFSVKGIYIYGLHQRINIGAFGLAAGDIYLYNADYQQHDPYLNLNYHYKGLSVGASGHISYDTIEGDAAYQYYGDLGLGYEAKGVKGELKYLKLGLDERELGAYLLKRVNEELDFALGLALQKDEKPCFKVGTKGRLNSFLSLGAAWQNSPARLGVGAIIEHQDFRIHYGVRTHYQGLKPSYGLALDYRW